MLIALHDSDASRYPNLALMKLAAYHRRGGDIVEWFNPQMAWNYDRVYSSKVFTWNERDPRLPADTICGGTGHDIVTVLPDKIEHICPDYSLYGCEQSYGFLTRGCIRNCEWCFVPKKEGKIRANANIEEFCRHKEVVLMDNNVLAHPHGLDQIEKMGRLGLKVDFNQGLDARLIDAAVAKRLGKLTWLHPVRLACDTVSQIESIQKAVTLLRWHNVTPRRYSCYVLVRDVADALERVKFLKGMDVDPFVQPYRAPYGAEATTEQRHFARWCNQRAVYKTRKAPRYDYVCGEGEQPPNNRGATNPANQPFSIQSNCELGNYPSRPSVLPSRVQLLLAVYTINASRRCLAPSLRDRIAAFFAV